MRDGKESLPYVVLSLYFLIRETRPCNAEEPRRVDLNFTICQ